MSIPEFVPFFDLNRQYQQLKPEILAATEAVFERSGFIDGPEVAQLEADFAAFQRGGAVVATSSGTSALHLLMLLQNLSQGDEVIVPAMTYIATPFAVSYTGAKPVFVDIDEENWQLSPQRVAEAINSNTKGIFAVHLYGQLAPMHELQQLADKHNIWLLEDAAQAHGATYKGKKAGILAAGAGFSLYPSKNLGAAGHGGLLWLMEQQQAEQARQLRAFGAENKYVHQQLGYNYRIGGVEAAVCRVKLKYLNNWNSRRRALAARYQQELKLPDLQLQQQLADTEGVYHLFVAQHPQRERLEQHLNKHNIGFGRHYPLACHQQPVYANQQHAPAPVAEKLAVNSLSLPMFPELTDAEQERVISVVNSF